MQSKVSAAEAMWGFKVTEEDFTLRYCDHSPLLFKNMFSDSTICRFFSMSKSKVSYNFQDGLGPLLLNGFVKAYTVQVVVLRSCLMKQLQNKR